MFIFHCITFKYNIVRKVWYYYIYDKCFQIEKDEIPTTFSNGKTQQKNGKN